MSDNLFATSGIHALVDGQFGSTGKGALAAWLAYHAVTQGVKFKHAISNAGPNSGHTFYHNGRKHVLKQLPTFAVASYLYGETIPVRMTAGAIIDKKILIDEASRYPGIPITIHPNAVMVTDEDKSSEHSGSIAAVAGTRSGAGAALARKVAREPDAIISAHVGDYYDYPSNVFLAVHNPLDWRRDRIFMEVSQGFSLGYHSKFYPKTTSRECTVAQGIADAQMPPQSVTKTYMSMRTFPIRVGNFEGHSSGGWYHDQREVTWAELGQEPELTTVTQRERRIATFSDRQLFDAVNANAPDFIFLNFLNYLPVDQHKSFIDRVKAISGGDVGIIKGYGPMTKDIAVD